MGDGVLAYFGWPQAHEDDAERAVRAGLALVATRSASSSTPAATPLAARVGIATGLVVVGELIGEGAAQEEAVVGETPNLAARLQALAEPGSVVISQATRRLVGGLFELADLGPLRLKGFAEPLAAFRVEGEGRAEGRFEALRGAAPDAAGRARARARACCWSAGPGPRTATARWCCSRASRASASRACSGRCASELSGEPHVALSHFCSPYHTNSALYPIIAQLERAAGFARRRPAEAKLAKLEALLGQATEQLDEAVPLIGGAARRSRPASATRPLNLSPQRQKQRTLEVLIEQLAGLARDRPVLDAVRGRALGRPLDAGAARPRWSSACARLPVLVVLTYRPEFSPPWIGQRARHLADRSTASAGARGRRWSSGSPAARRCRPRSWSRSWRKTDGVPLFVEELTKTVLESGLLTDAGDRYELTGPLPPLAIPATLHDSLMARLDRLAPVKEVAQIGAVIGREFSHELLAAVSPLSEAELDAALDQLVAAELIFRRGTPPDATYSFKHALVQDAAYQSLLKSSASSCTRGSPSVLEERFPEIAEAEPELLAHH